VGFFTIERMGASDSLVNAEAKECFDPKAKAFRIGGCGVKRPLNEVGHSLLIPRAQKNPSTTEFTYFWAKSHYNNSNAELSASVIEMEYNYGSSTWDYLSAPYSGNVRWLQSCA
jgi:hypothetical protein